jgi:cleavage and polyadenylation specificity factor subunit 3
MFMVEIAGLKILFTGDYSREDDRHLVCAEVPLVKPDILICESTYGTASHMPRLEKEARLMKLTTEILQRGGRVLMPVFALGMAQELLLILDEYWEKYPKFQTFPIYYASNLARKCMDVYRTYINTMNDKIKRAMFEGEGRNPWDFKWVRSLKNIERFDDVGGCVMLASPGMLQVGPRFRSSYPIPSISSSYLGLQWCTEDRFTIAQWLLSILYICFVSNLSDHVCVMKIYIIS